MFLCRLSEACEFCGRLLRPLLRAQRGVGLAERLAAASVLGWAGNWAEEEGQHLAKDDVMLLLISPDFMAS